MRVHTTLVTATAILALAVPVAAGAAPPANHHYAPTAVVPSVQLGTSAAAGACTLTMIDGHVWGYRCPGSTVTRAGPGRCTLTVAVGYLWTFGCPAATTGGQTIEGAARGAIPRGCTPIRETGYLWKFGCPRSAFAGAT